VLVLGSINRTAKLVGRLPELLGVNAKLFREICFLSGAFFIRHFRVPSLEFDVVQGFEQRFNSK